MQFIDRDSNGTGPQSLFYSIRPDAGVRRPLVGSGLAKSPPTVAVGDDQLLGQLDWVEAGVISGWACVRSNPGQKLKVWVSARENPRPRISFCLLCSRSRGLSLSGIGPGACHETLLRQQPRSAARRADAKFRQPPIRGSVLQNQVEWAKASTMIWPSR